MISADVTVARLLDEHPQLVEVLVGFNPHFEQLRNTMLRKVMGPRVTVAQAARIAGVPVEEMLTALRRAVGETDLAPHPALSPEGSGSSAAPRAPEGGGACPPPAPCQQEGGGEGEGEGESPMPVALASVPESQHVHLDVRDDIGRGQEPFARIMAAVKQLRDGDVFALRAPFEPIPLYGVLGKRGLAHWSERLGAADWRVWFYREAAVASAAPAAAAPEQQASAPRGRLRLDVRGLEPPQPMVRVLEQLASLGPGQVLEVIHDRRPLFLYPQLDDRGFAHETDEPEAGVIRILVRRKGAAR